MQAPGKARAGIRATTLVVRMVSTVDNYDYLTEFEFVPDGSIRIDLVFAGYCEVRWFNKDINPWERDLGEVAHAPGVAAPLHCCAAQFLAKVLLLVKTGSVYCHTSVLSYQCTTYQCTSVPVY